MRLGPPGSIVLPTASTFAFDFSLEEPDKRWTGSHSERSKKITYSDATDRLCTYN